MVNVAGTFAARVGFVKVSSVGFPEMIYRVVDQHDVELLAGGGLKLLKRLPAWPHPVLNPHRISQSAELATHSFERSVAVGL